jgi:hypothetical protein
VQQRAAQPKPLTEVREAIVAALTRAGFPGGPEGRGQAREAAVRHPFQAVLQELRASADRPTIDRRDPSVQAQVREAVFAMPAPRGNRPSARSGSTTAAPPWSRSPRCVRQRARSKTQADRAVQEAQNLGQNEVMAYVAEVRRTADVRKNPKAFE